MSPTTSTPKIDIDKTHASFSHDETIPNMTLEESSDLYTHLRSMINNADNDMNVFPFDLSKYHKLKIDPFVSKELTSDELKAIQENIDLCRDIIVFFTSCGSASGYGGHTGGAFDTVPEVVLFDAFFRACPDKFVPVFYDEAGHRVATQYLISALDGYIAPEFLRFYRFGGGKLPGHPELGLTPGIEFSSGRLGHMWGMVNGIAMSEGKRVLLLGSDGSQMEGNNAEAARLAVAKHLSVTLVIDDNDITITGHPKDYLPGFDVAKTLQGHGLKVDSVGGEDIQELYLAVRNAVIAEGPTVVICKRTMAPGINGVEGTNHGHDTIATKYSIPYLQSRGHDEAAKYLQLATKTKDPSQYSGSGQFDAMRKAVGQTIADYLLNLDPTQRKNYMVIDSDLAGSTGFNAIQKATPDIFCHSGVMERGNFSAAAGFGMHPQKQGAFSTFAAFLEMLCSEITMARLNRCNVFSHFSHSGVDDMSDNTCHFGINILYADNGLEEHGYQTRLYFPADVAQAKKITSLTFPLGDDNKGLRFLFTTRSKTPMILKDDGTPFYDDNYKFQPGVDEIIRSGKAGYILSFGDALYRSLDAVTKLKAEGYDVGLINKPTINIPDPKMMEMLAACPFCLIVEPIGYNTGVGSKFGTWLLETEYARLQKGPLCKFGRVGTYREGGGGLWEQAYHQGYDSLSVQNTVKGMIQGGSSSSCSLI